MIELHKIANHTLLGAYKPGPQRMAEQAAKMAEAKRVSDETTRRILAANPILIGGAR